MLIVTAGIFSHRTSIMCFYASYINPSICRSISPRPLFYKQMLVYDNTPLNYYNYVKSQGTVFVDWDSTVFIHTSTLLPDGPRSSSDL